MDYESYYEFLREEQEARRDALEAIDREEDEEEKND